MTYRQSEVKQASAGEHILPQHIVLLFVVHLKIHINLFLICIILCGFIFSYMSVFFFNVIIY